MSSSLATSRRFVIQSQCMVDNWDHLRRLAEREVERTFASLPHALRERGRQLPVTLEPIPNAALVEDGIASDTLGIFTGAEHTDEEHTALPPQIILFLDNLWDYAEQDEQVFRGEVRVTLLHELGHYLGLNEGDLEDRGLK